MNLVRLRRAAGGTMVALLLAVALLPTVALGDHIPSTGPVPGNCVEFQAGNTGTKSPLNYPDVDITLVSWTDEPGDPHTVTFSIAGLAADQYVDISVKSGQSVDEDGPFGNGTHTFSNDRQNAISHIRLCVFVETTTTTTPTTETTTPTTETTTPTTETTTPTTETTTPTTETTTPTTETTTPTTQTTTPTTETVETTIPPEVEEETTSTQPEEDEDDPETEDETEETLPFTGLGTDGMAGAAAVALGAGAGLMYLTRRNPRHLSD